MKFWPSDTFVIQTSMPIENVMQRFAEQTEPRKWFRLSKQKAFQGQVSQAGFKIQRIVRYRNSFLPVVRGNFRVEKEGVAVEVHMALHPLVAVFMCIWFGVVILAMGSIIAGFLYDRTEMEPAVAVPFAMFIFGCVLVSGGFWFEAKKQRRMLIAMFEEGRGSEQAAQTDRAEDGAPV